MHQNAFWQVLRLFQSRYLHTNTINFKAKYLEIDTGNRVLCKLGSSSVAGIWFIIYKHAFPLSSIMNCTLYITNVKFLLGRHDMKVFLGKDVIFQASWSQIPFAIWFLIYLKNLVNCVGYITINVKVIMKSGKDKG